jgi:hypothetical protein
MNNKAYLGDFMTYFYILTLVVIFSIVFYFFLVNDGRITFNTSYLEEYANCQNDLEELSPDCPKCPDCICKTDSCFVSALYAFILGIILTSLLFLNKDKLLKYLKKKSKETK